MPQYSGIYTLSQVAEAVKNQSWTGIAPPQVEYLVVAGGGGGSGDLGAGGGGGGLLSGFLNTISGSAITVTVGAGGTAGAATRPSDGGNGSNSVFGSVTASGGGGGSGYGTPQRAGVPGGSGGGGGSTDGSVFAVGGVAISGQGNAGGNGSVGSTGYASGGGGGAGTVGLNTFKPTSGGIAGNGGAGIASDISGTRTTYAGGGGGGANTGTAGTGGAGGGGNGGLNALGTAGAANTGGGGGGTGTNQAGGRAGGSGIVIISYPDLFAPAVSTTGSPTISTSGAGSLSLNGSSYFRYAGGLSPFSFGSGDFTIEMWLYTTTTGTLMIPFDFRPSVNGAYPYVFKDTNNKMYYYVDTASRIISTNTIPNGSWFHFAICRNSTNTRMFINGTQEGSTWTDTTNYSIGTPGPTFFADTGNGYPWTGNASNVRVVKGVALYTSNFAVPTAPLTAVSGTSLLLNTVSGSYLTDGSTNAYNPTVVGGSPVWNASSPFPTGAGLKNRVYTWTSSGSITF